MGRKLRGLCPLGERELGLPNTKLPGRRPTSVPNGFLIHPADWPQETWTAYYSLGQYKLQKWGGVLCPFLWGWRQLGPRLTQCGRAEGYMHAKFHLDASNRLATIHLRHGQSGQTHSRDRQATLRQHRTNRISNGRPKGVRGAREEQRVSPITCSGRKTPWKVYDRGRSHYIRSCARLKWRDVNCTC